MGILFMEKIEDYDNYFISNCGDVYSNKLKRFMCVSTMKSGYKFVTLKQKGKKPKTFYIHRLVAKAFIPNPENKKEVNHINGIKSDNRIENLEWCTHEENMKHGHKTGLFKNIKRERDMNCKEVYQENTGLRFKSIRKAAKHFNISEQYVSQMVRGVCNNNYSLKLVKI